MGEERIPRRLRVDLSRLEAAFDDTSWERSYYLDLETGKVVTVTDEIRWELDSIYEEATLEHVTGEEVDVTPVLRRLSLPEWEKEALCEANEVENGFGTRYISVPRSESRQAYGDMEEFTATVKNERLRARLRQAGGGRRPFRRFKDVLADDPRERERWFRFKDNRIRERMLAWLEDERIELIDE